MMSNANRTLFGTITLFPDNFGMFTYSVSPGLAEDGVKVVLCNVVSAFRPKGCFGILFGSILSDMVFDIFRNT